MSAKRLPPMIGSLASQKNFDIRWEAFELCSRLTRVRAHLHAHISEPLSLAAAGIACLERTYFARYFREWTGVTFKYWVEFERVQHAAKLLSSSESSIWGIAMDCGFDERTFRRAFIRITGFAPLAFRARHNRRRANSESNNR